MWFEIIPSFGIITLALAAPGYALYGLHKLVLGNVSTENYLNILVVLWRGVNTCLFQLGIKKRCTYDDLGNKSSALP